MAPKWTFLERETRRCLAWSRCGSRRWRKSLPGTFCGPMCPRRRHGRGGASVALSPFPSWTMRLLSSMTAVTASASPFLAEHSEHVVSPSALDCAPLVTIVGAKGSVLLPGNGPSVYSPTDLSDDGARTKFLSVPQRPHLRRRPPARPSRTPATRPRGGLTPRESGTGACFGWETPPTHAPNAPPRAARP